MYSDDLLTSRFRTGAHFQLKEWTMLSRLEQEGLLELADSEDLYGLFIPDHTKTSLTVKIASVDSALLYYHFRQHDRLPHSFLNRQGKNVQKEIARLVLDEILEIEWQDSFVSGSRAVPAVYPYRPQSNKISTTYLSLLSMQAVSYAYLLKRKDVGSLAQWLYTCHTYPTDGFAGVPVSGENDVYHYLLAESGNHLAPLSAQWRFTPAQEDFRWFSWHRNDTFHSTGLPTFKLYISPPPQQLPAVFDKMLLALAGSRAFCFKAGATKEGLLRPDKLLVYFSSKADLMQMATELKPLLVKVPVHGVPFTAQLDDNGLLSWGVDPPSGSVLQASEGGSWRTGVTEQLAIAISAGRQHHADWQQALPFITAKLYTAGIDIDSWTPTGI